LNWTAKMRFLEHAISNDPASPRRKNGLQRAEVRKLLDAECEFHVRLAIILKLTTAARATAALELTWDRVDFERAQVNLRTGSGTGKGRAVVPMNDSLRKAPTEARDAALTDYVVEWGCKPLKSIKKGFARAVRNAGLEDV